MPIRDSLVRGGTRGKRKRTPGTWDLPAFFLLCFFVTPLLAQDPSSAPEEHQHAEEHHTHDLTVLDQRPGEGERCIVCKQFIHGDEVLEVRYKGRRFHVKTDMLDDFDADPETYFVELQARSGLFDERAVGAGRVSYGWLFFGGYVVVGLIFSALCGTLAIGRGHPPLPWFFAGLVGNVAALVVLFVTPRGSGGTPTSFTKVPTTRAPARCSDCGLENHPAATACSGCGHTLTPAASPETARV